MTYLEAQAVAAAGLAALTTNNVGTPTLWYSRTMHAALDLGSAANAWERESTYDRLFRLLELGEVAGYLTGEAVEAVLSQRYV